MRPAIDNCEEAEEPWRNYVLERLVSAAQECWINADQRGGRARLDKAVGRVRDTLFDAAHWCARLKSPMPRPSLEQRVSDQLRVVSVVECEIEDLVSSRLRPGMHNAKALFDTAFSFAEIVEAPNAVMDRIAEQTEAIKAEMQRAYSEAMRRVP